MSARKTRPEHGTDLALLALHVVYGEYSDAAEGRRGYECRFRRA